MARQIEGRFSPPDPIQNELVFVADPDLLSAKGLGPLQHSSWFSLEKRPRHEPIVHSYESYEVHIEAGSPLGIATIYDYDLLLFAVSQMVAAMKQGREVGRTIKFQGSEFYRFVGKRDAGTQNYRYLEDTIERLNGTRIRTNLFATDEVERGRGWLNWLSDSYVIERRKKRDDVIVRLTLPDFIYRAVQNEKNWLTIDRSYFGIMSATSRFLYLWGRKAAGYREGDHWEESFELIHEKSGSRQPLRKFKETLREAIRTQSIPGYTLRETGLTKRQPKLYLERNKTHPLLLTGSFGKIRKKALPKFDDSANQMRLFGDES
jgi:plasmid replication initiation protein